jgi:hypothetical protein
MRWAFSQRTLRQDVQNSDLAQFDTIIIDNRGYEAHLN